MAIVAPRGRTGRTTTELEEEIAARQADALDLPEPNPLELLEADQDRITAAETTAKAHRDL